MALDKSINDNLDNDDRPIFTIGIAAEMIAVSAHALHFYESSGLILPQRTESKRRIYSRNDTKRLQFFRQLREVCGLNIAGENSLLALIPCWQINKCNPDDQQICETFTPNHEPCWITRTKGEICMDNDCRLCPVYQDLEPLTDPKLFLHPSKKYPESDQNNPTTTEE